MKKKKTTPFAATVVIWAICVVGILWYVSQHSRIEYKEVLAESPIIYIEKEVEKHTEVDVGEQPYYAIIAESITEQEINLLAGITYLEARGESILGQRAVIEVILNRVLDDRFPNTIEEVIYQDTPCVQFSPAHRLKTTVPTEEQYNAVKAVLEDSEPTVPNNVLYFSTSANGRKVYKKIGNHYFCY